MRNLLAWTSCALLCLFSAFSLASDHKEAPLTAELPTADISDLYAFTNPNDPSKLVLIMTVNPFSVPSEGVAFTFSSRYLYRFHIDNDGDAVADHLLGLQFSGDGHYTAMLPDGSFIDGTATAPTEEPVANEPQIFGNGDVRVFAGPRDDPFFFDIVGYFRFLSGTGIFSGSDGFAGYNVSAIVVELPVAMVAGDGSVLNIWATTATPFNFKNAADQSLRLGRVEDRVGNPAVATALIPRDMKDAYNRGRPENDAADFAGTIVASLTALGTSADNIGILASVAVPDVLTIDTAQPSGFPNGRLPEDDVMDTLLGLILNNPDIGDAVDANDAPFLTEFPFLAPPWQPL